jgi:hypothetical protein
MPTIFFNTASALGKGVLNTKGQASGESRCACVQGAGRPLKQ